MTTAENSVSMRADLRTVFESYQLLAFVTLTLGISWGWWALAWFTIGNGELSMGLIIPGGFGPPIAAALVTWGSGGSLRDWISQLIRFRVSRGGTLLRSSFRLSPSWVVSVASC